MSGHHAPGHEVRGVTPGGRERTLAIHSHTYRTVESILKKGLNQKPLVTPPSLRTHPHHEFVRGAGAGYYQ